MVKKEPKEYLERLKQMTGEMRVKIAADLSRATEEIAKSAIHNEHPEWTSSQIQQELLRRLYGPNIRSQTGHSGS